MSVVFIGFMGSGKTTAARAAAELLGCEAIDVDAELERRLGKSIARVFAEEGEGAFRAAEERLTVRLLSEAADREAVLALGGGAVTSQAVREALAGHTVIWLDIDAETAWLRVRGSARPLARDRAALEALHREREPLYAALAGAIVPSRRSERMAPVLAALEGLPAGIRLLWAASASGDYPVYVGAGAIAHWPPAVAGRRFLVTDRNVEPLYGERLEPLAARVAIAPGERSKTIAHAEMVWTELARAGMRRDEVLVALGGGVVGDLAGFCAATYQRGVAHVQVPTSLLAQVDSAYGGKTGVDLPEAKNYVGAYHQPAAVLTDPETLATLPREELAAGYAEVVKTALIAGGSLWEKVRGGADPSDPDVILACARTKLEIVARDERDAGLRQVLNLGHTVGHAIETVTGYTRYRHGEAVGLGLLAELRLSGSGELRAEVGELLARHGLPTRLAGADPGAVVAATALDKKRRGGERVPFVLLERPGAPRPGQPIPAGDVLQAVRELTA